MQRRRRVCLSAVLLPAARLRRCQDTKLCLEERKGETAEKIIKSSSSGAQSCAASASNPRLTSKKFTAAHVHGWHGGGRRSAVFRKQRTLQEEARRETQRVIFTRLDFLTICVSAEETPAFGLMSYNFIKLLVRTERLSLGKTPARETGDKSGMVCS